MKHVKKTLKLKHKHKSHKKGGELTDDRLEELPLQHPASLSSHPSDLNYSDLYPFDENIHRTLDVNEDNNLDETTFMKKGNETMESAAMSSRLRNSLSKYRKGGKKSKTSKNNKTKKSKISKKK